MRQFECVTDKYMDDKFKINLLVDNEKYPLTIKRDEEIYYRDAAKQIDYKLNKYRRLYPNFSSVKHWAMAALELAYENVKMKDMNDTQPYHEKLEQLMGDLDEYIADNE